VAVEALAAQPLYACAVEFGNCMRIIAFRWPSGSRTAKT
jgi:hypothetical protein